jgi:hypothetical protein
LSVNDCAHRRQAIAVKNAGVFSVLLKKAGNGSSKLDQKAILNY